jgi:uncharacterized delta-60 repeat protein
MKKILTGAVMAFAVLAACNTNPSTNPTINPASNLETSKQPAIDAKKSQVLGVLEVELSSEQGSVSSAKFIPTGSGGLSAKGVAVPITAANWVFIPGTTTYMTDANFKYLQNTITLENKTGTSFSNLAMYALNTPSNIGGTAFSAVKTLAGVALTEPTASTVARAVMPTHGMTNTTTVDPNKADLMLYTPSEAAAVQAQLVTPNFALSSPTVLEYGFLARNLAAGARAIGTSAAACPSGPTCNKATITWAFKFPLSLTNSSTLGKFTLKYVVVNEPGSFVVQSLEEQAADKVSGIPSDFGTSSVLNAFGQLRTLAGTKQILPNNLKPLCRVRTAILPSSFLGPDPLPSTSGSVDVCFGANGRRGIRFEDTSSVYNTIIQSNGKILIMARGSNNAAAVLIRYNKDGSIDTNFGINGVSKTNLVGSSAFLTLSDREIKGIDIQSDEKILISGENFTIERFNSDGSKDTAFGINGVRKTFEPVSFSFLSQSNSVKSLANGKILASGATRKYEYNSFTRNFQWFYYFTIVRYNYNGSVDTSFGIDGINSIRPDSRSSSVSYSMVVQPDGKIVLGGSSYYEVFTNYAVISNLDSYLVRFDENGDLDLDFGVGGQILMSDRKPQADAIVFVGTQSNGKIIAIGCTDGASSDNVACSGGNKYMISRYNPDGAVDSTFGTNGIILSLNEKVLSYNILTASLLSDDKMIITGTYLPYEPEDGKKFFAAKFDKNGILDVSFGNSGEVYTSFNSDRFSFSFGGFSNSVAVQNDGKILLAGTNFYSDLSIYGGSSHISLMRLNP